MFGLIILIALLVVCFLIPPLAIIIIPFVLLSILTGLFFRSLSKSITGPIGNDVKWTGERIATAIEGERNSYKTSDEDSEDNSISSSLQAAQIEYEEEQNKKKSIKPKTIKQLKKKDNDRLIQDIEDFLKEPD